MAGIETKRKIDESIALLNSVLAQPSKKQSTGAPTSPSSSSSSSLPSSPNLSDPTARPRKRNFLPPRPAVLDKLSRLSGSSTSRPTLSDSIAASIAASGSLPKGDIGSVSPIPPKQETFRAKWRYMPWSREQFDERLQTFKPSTWFDKPKLVNAVECAKRGWINTSDDRLECCGGCGGVVIVKIDQDLEVEGSKKSEDGIDSVQDLDDDFTPEFDIEVLGPKFHAMLTDNHVKNCPWKTHPCDDSIYKFPVVSQSRARQELAERAKKLQTMANSPLIVHVRHPLTTEQIEHIGRMVPDVTDPKLLALAMFGWTVPEKMQVLSCQACHTQCSYIPSVDNFLDDDDDILMEGDDGQGHGQKDSGFDAVHSHKWYCYWVDPEHNLPKKEEGWKALVQLLMPKDRKDPKASGSTGSADSDSGARLEPLDAVAQIKRILRGQATLSSSSLTQ